MFVTPEMAARRLGRKLQKLRDVPANVVEQGQRTLMPLIPVFTSTYYESIYIQYVDDMNVNSAALLITSESLLASAARNLGGESWTPEEYIEESPHYPPRIEASGRPKKNKQPSGQFAWRTAAASVKAALPAAIRKAYNG